jgi:hypothetical protein
MRPEHAGSRLLVDVLLQQQQQQQQVIRMT